MEKETQVAIRAYGSVRKANKAIQEYNNGIILMCPNCKKLDIHPITHHIGCDPEYEQSRIINLEYYD